MRRVILASILAVFISPLASAQTRTYLALGDSIAWGWTLGHAQPSVGNQGYAKLFVDWLQGQDGTSPKLVNLGIPGETVESYFDLSCPYRVYNTNYSRVTPISQEAAFLQTLNSESQAGRTVSTVTYSLGLNDVIQAEQAVGFFNQSLFQQEIQMDPSIANAVHWMDLALEEIRSKLPNAELIVLGYYNPYRADPNSFRLQITDYGVLKVNAILQSTAAKYGARYVDVYGRFLGLESMLTNTIYGDIHPNDAGYQAITDVLVAAAGPRPESVSVSPNKVVGGAQTIGTISLEGPTGTGGENIALSSNNPNAVVQPFASADQGTNSAQFLVDTLPVQTQVVAQISATFGGKTASTTVTLTPIPLLTGLSLTPSTVTGGGSSVATVTLSAPANAGGVWIGMNSSDPVVTVPQSVFIPAGLISKSFAVTSTPVNASTSAVLSATQSAITKTASLTVLPPVFTKIGIAPANVFGGQNATVTLTLNAPAPSGGIQFAIAASGNDVDVPATVTIVAGSSTVNFVATTSQVSQPIQRSIQAKANGVTRTATLTIQP